MKSDKQEIIPERDVDLFDGVFWSMDRDKYELRDPSGRAYFSMSGDTVRGIQKEEKLSAPKQAFVFGRYLRTGRGEWVPCDAD